MILIYELQCWKPHLTQEKIPKNHNLKTAYEVVLMTTFFLCNFPLPSPCTQSDIYRFPGVSRFPALQRSEHTTSYSASQLRWWIVKINDLIRGLCLDQSSAHRKCSSVSHCYYLLDAHYLQRGFTWFLESSLLKTHNVVGETGHVHSS